MASRFTQKYMLKFVDGMSRGYKRATNNIITFSRKTNNALNRVNRTVDKLNRKINKFAKSRFAKVGMAGIAVGVGLVARQYVEFDGAVTSASAKFKDLNLATEQGRATLEKLRKTARKVGADTQFNASQAAQGLDFLAMAGFSSEQAMASLRPVVDLATVANRELARATDIASDTLGAFGLMTDDTVKLQKNFTRVNDVMAKTMASTNVDMETMFETIKKAGPDFEAAGQSIETFSAFTGIMADAGKKGSEAGTVMRNFITRLAKPTAEASVMIGRLGLKTADSNGNFLDAADILEQLQNKLKGMGNQQRAAAVGTIFGTRAQTGINILLKTGVGKLRNFREELINSAGASKKMADIIRQSLGNRLKALSSAATEAGFKVFAAFDGDAKDGITNLTKAVRKFDMGPIITGFKITFAILEPVIKLLFLFAPAIIPIIVATKLWVAATKLQAFWQVASNSTMVNTIGLWWLNNKAILVNAASMKILKFALAGIGIGLIIIAIVAIIEHWDVLKISFQIGLAKIILQWKTLKAEVLNYLSILGVVNKETAAHAAFEAFKASFQLSELEHERKGIIEKKEAEKGLVSPDSQKIINESTQTNKSVIDVNVNGPKGTTAKHRGKMAPGGSLNLGVNPA